MNDQNSEIQLLFEFPDSTGKKRPIFFKQPEEIVKAVKIDEVIPALERVETAIKEGYYAAGYLSYEASPAFDSAYAVHDHVKMPLLWFGLFKTPSKDEIIHSSIDFSLSEWESNIQPDTYTTQLQKIKSAIARGETYQVNYTLRMRNTITGNDYAFYRQLSKKQSGYNAYLNMGRFRIMSASPELFFRMTGRDLETRPMKGTAKRGRWTEEDRENRDWLFHSEKNRAENVMIVDLLRNDVGQIAETGSVKVSRLFEIESYPTVLQMTSTVKARLKENITLTDVFGALFPCGSITGAPKVSTMKWIRELEDAPREVYCGTIGFIKPSGEAIFNVPIRTVMVDSESSTAEYGVGSGITGDSNSGEEMREVLTKAKLLTDNHSGFQLLESLKLTDGNYVLYRRHLSRMKKSAAYFSFSVDFANVEDRLKQFAQNHQNGQYKVRLTCSETGEIVVEGTPCQEIRGPMPIVLVKKPVHSNNPFLYHKTTNRKIYEEQQLEKQDRSYDVLLINERGELTEFTNGNLVVKINGELLTPTRESGLLNGTFREELLSNGIIQETVLSPEDLHKCSDMWFINSVRGWIEVFQA